MPVGGPHAVPHQDILFSFIRLVCRRLSAIYDLHNPFKNKTVGFYQRPQPLHGRCSAPGRTLVPIGELPLHVAVINL